MKVSDTLSLFLKQPHLFYQPLRFYVKNLTPSPHLPFFLKIPKGWGRIMPYLFQVKKVTFTDWKVAVALSVRSR